MATTPLEIRRQLFHIIVGTGLALLFHFQILKPIHFTILIAAMIVTFILYLRFKIPGVHYLLAAMERKKNMNSFPGLGATFFVLGMTIAMWIFPHNIATAAILILVWADGTSSLLGPFGTTAYLNPKKMWEGIIIGILAGTAAAAFIIPFSHSFIAATISMLIEGLDLKLGQWKIDDNLLIPLIAGTVLVLLMVV
jgi:dolichol kinase